MSVRRRAAFTETGERYVLRDHRLMDTADMYLWNDTMFVQVDHRARCTALFNQPEHAFYAKGRQRCFYIRDDESGEYWSAPFDPVCREPDEFEFSVATTDLRWVVSRDDVEAVVELTVPRDDQVEIWRVSLTNTGHHRRRMSLFSLMPIGFMGWLFHRADYDPALGAIVCDHFPYYADYREYYRLRVKKNKVFFAADIPPVSWECGEEAFTGFSGMHAPEALRRPTLKKGGARFESITAVLQHRWSLQPGRARTVTFLFGPARSNGEIRRMRGRYLRPGGFDRAVAGQRRRRDRSRPCLTIDTPDTELNHFVNHWLPNQTMMQGYTFRVDMAPHTRNALIDTMGLTWIDPEAARERFLRIYSFQQADGAMPMGFQLDRQVRLNAQRRIFHRDINVWGALAIETYLEETQDWAILGEEVAFADSSDRTSLYDHVARGLTWQAGDRGRRGLSLMGEGDWNDPLNMAGYRGKGESGWLTQAVAVAADCWARVARGYGKQADARRFRALADRCRDAVRRRCWDGEWYARGTTDAGKLYGVETDREGKIFLNTQSWAMIAGEPDPRRIERMIRSVDRYLDTPWGPEMLGPGYTKMREDIGRLCQKHPGFAENGSVYCHAALFYAHGLYAARRGEEAFSVYRRMLTGAKGNPIERSGQLPLYIPSLYGGRPMDHNAGKSNHYFRTGSCPWFYFLTDRMLFGIRPEKEGFRVDPQVPAAWKTARLVRRFRGARYDIEYRRRKGLDTVRLRLDGKLLASNLVPTAKPGTKHTVVVEMPAGAKGRGSEAAK